jgi:hypothetical protein
VLSIFDVIDDDQNLVWYKPLEPDRIADAIARVEWRQAIPNVGGQLLSNLILAHGLPNANHRTALGFLNAYLATIEPAFEPPATTTANDEWIDWIDEYITESKRLLRSRRTHVCSRDSPNTALPESNGRTASKSPSTNTTSQVTIRGLTSVLSTNN